MDSAIPTNKIFLGFLASPEAAGNRRKNKPEQTNTGIILQGSFQHPANKVRGCAELQLGWEMHEREYSGAITNLEDARKQ
ncbi:hypothetical protein SADUNF_Sadunf02G0138300 [Salix dunnii]|uniref:Uncharacterized protein n=1 Tax=Salix dunnii TaxID=1413687 RepID=A0A835THC0_9ROSI|nr:hypothetical protein SADUNF_Sadunf02G0138300 [Salix dunnii]